MGSPRAPIPQGIDSAGRPAMLTGTVHTSPMYISSGLFRFSPSRQAVVGATGASRKSNRSKTRAKSRWTRVRTSSAFL